MRMRNRDLLRTLMTQRGYSSQSLSDAIRDTGYAVISDRSIRYLLAGQRDSTAPEVAASVCLLLGVDLDVLWLPSDHREAELESPVPAGSSTLQPSR